MFQEPLHHLSIFSFAGLDGYTAKFLLGAVVIALLVVTVWSVAQSSNPEKIIKLERLYVEEESLPPSPEFKDQVGDSVTVVAILTNKNRNVDVSKREFYLNHSNDLNGVLSTALDSLIDGSGGSVTVRGQEIITVTVDPKNEQAFLISEK